jgi:hypothetical protein
MLTDSDVMGLLCLVAIFVVMWTDIEELPR